MDKSKKNITNRIKTFDDAMEELGEDHPLVKEYNALCDAEVTENMVAYSRLLIVTEALNEGWKPNFVEINTRYFPYFRIYNDEEIKEILEEEKPFVIFHSKGYMFADGGMRCVKPFADTLFMDGGVGARMAFKTKELAEYAGNQFIKLYADYFLKY